MDHRTPTAVPVVLVILGAWLAVYELNVLVGFTAQDGVGFGRAAHLIISFAAAGLCVAGALRRRDGTRVAWLVVALGIVAWNAGDTYWTTVLIDQAEIPVPSTADVGYLAFPVLAFGAIALLVRPAVNATSRLMLVDGVAAGLAIGALAATIVVGDLLAAEGVAINLTYAISDLVLLGLVVGAVAIRGWRVDRMWALMGVAILAFWIADTSYLLAIADGSYAFPGALDVGWSGCFLMLAAASWCRSTPVEPVARLGLRVTLLPLTFAALALGVLAHAGLGDGSWLQVVLAVGSLLAVGVRVAVTLRTHVELLDGSRREALTDPLTGLGNRRKLMLDLRDAVDADASRALVLYDLDGFKHYNDSFGHPAGDALLELLGQRLDAQAGPSAQAYRMGGDEFCVLAELGSRTVADVAAKCADALSDSGRGFMIGASFGAVEIPREAREAEEALRTADQRMYAQKHSGRSSAGRQISDVLVTALVERNGELGVHVRDVARMAQRVAGELGLDDEQCELVARAAALHDVGKVAIPDAILQKPGSLDETEWAFVRRHTIVGERIIRAAPTMHGVADVVRSSHERWDGDGYPDALAGEDIPLGARIVAVCDAYDAMRTTRAYSAALGEEETLRELRACSGSQFDPAVVEVFCLLRSSVPPDAVPA